MAAADQLAALSSVSLVCQALGVGRASFYRHHQLPPATNKLRPKPKRSLSQAERQTVLKVLSSKRFVDKLPVEIYTTLLNEGTYLCSVRTMYRILAQEDDLIRHRRNHLRHSSYHKADSLVTQPNQLWLWDIVKLPGPDQRAYFYLYVISDAFSRYVVGWRVACWESISLAGQLIKEACQKQQISRAQLTLYSDRVSLRASKSIDLLLSDLGVSKNLSRHDLSNDKPLSKSQFNNLYPSAFPSCFKSIEEIRSFCQKFFDWYNNKHRHSGIKFLTPVTLHYSLAQQVREHHQAVLTAAYQAHPERFVRQHSQLQASLK